MNRTNKTTVPKLSGPIIAGNCISCMGMVRISTTMSVNATVRCPHCQQSFVLKDLLDQSLPPLEVVVNDVPEDAPELVDAPYIDTLHLKRDEQENRPEKPRVKFDIPKALKDGAKRRRRRRRSRSSSSGGERRSSSSDRRSARSDSGASNFVIPSVSPTDGASANHDTTTMGEAVERQRSTNSRSNRSGSRSRSSSARSGESSSYRGKVSTHASRLKEAKTEFDVLAISRALFGCVLAFTMAYLMLIWVFKTDPLGVAPAISKAVPFAIPSSMQDGKAPEVEVVGDKPKRELPSYLREDEDVKPFEPETLPYDSDRIAVPNIDPDEVFGQEFGL